MNLESNIEAILFFKGEPVKRKKLAEILNEDISRVNEALQSLQSSLIGRGVTLVTEGDSVMLGTSADSSALIEQLTKEELARDLGKAGLETLSIVLYKKEVSKKEIDYIRGVNSAFIIRNLMIRGLLERVEKGGIRGYSYKPTIELLSYMGINKLEDLPEYENVLREFEEFSKNESVKEISESDGK